MAISNPLFLLVTVALLLVVNFMIWSVISANRRRGMADETPGYGGPNDPVS